MYTITIEVTSNGLTKTIYDNNYDGAGKDYSTSKSYIFDDEDISKQVTFMKDLCHDCGLPAVKVQDTIHNYQKDIITTNKKKNNFLKRLWTKLMRRNTV